MATKKETKVENIAATAEPTFTGEQLAKADCFAENKDLVSALLEPEKEYTMAEAKEMIENYKKGQVK